MKKFSIIILSSIIYFGGFAHSQYDYYGDDVANEKPFINGDTLLGIIVILVIMFIIWLIKSSLRSVNEASKASKLRAEAERIKQKEILKEQQGIPVDLGLSVMWAPSNIGATSMIDSGTFYAWGELKEHYLYTKGLQGEASEIGDISGNPQYDIARKTMGNGWRMPTLKEGLELVEKCQWQKVSDFNHRGYKVIGPNGNSIFLPYTGMLTNLKSTSEPHYDVNTAYYWLSVPFGDKYASVLEFDMDIDPRYENPRCETRVFRFYGFCVRAVKDY